MTPLSSSTSRVAKTEAVAPSNRTQAGMAGASDDPGPAAACHSTAASIKIVVQGPAVGPRLDAEGLVPRKLLDLDSCDLHVHHGLSATYYSGWSQLCMRVAARQHSFAQCGRQDGGVSPALPALHAAFSSTATFFTCNRTGLDGSWEPGKSTLRTLNA
jgi:hypothetical protein